MISTTELSMANAIAHGGFGGFILQFCCENCQGRYFQILENHSCGGGFTMPNVQWNREITITLYPPGVSVRGGSPLTNPP